MSAKVFDIIDLENNIHFQCREDVYILDAAEEAGFDLPYSSRAGADPSSVARLISGQVDQSDGSYLDDNQKAAGFFLTDTSYPLSNCVVRFFAEDELHH
ncbi:2Fe-2S iron-sulfur cluster-binding protein [Pectobacterium brasiliense]|uniref:2Fe-2S iron-sulfur cluster-binding protein n=1 Tax=Pectobacterium TaxID=122277 RepID=UPI0001A44227|nr:MULTISPECIES: 2Fe-2S iron-sulfur cluster-binding protein [Pectobacterium]KRF66968.1 ferredoxin [Pectobacterium brasiliense]MBN3184549.1 ferredoxin [Pectobacterium brasiliense]MBN3189977.1 ferredoxin [Pectobacterium brasiliense]MBN3264575.1 ferredoxin [Pectobacterium brasiliense]MCG5048491.1 ferredoxin [Pectobacterium brasiliense]